MKFSIIIPCYNEEQSVPKLISELLKLNVLPEDIEIIFVENGSHDQTEKILKQQIENISWMHIVKVSVNKGYGYGIKQGLKTAKGEYLGWIHADLQFSPQEIEVAFNMLKHMDFPENVFLKGKRTNRPFIDRIFTLGMSFYETLLLKCPLFDINAQPCIFSRSLYMKWTEMAPDDFSLDLYAYYISKKLNAKIIRWKVRQSWRETGNSSWNTGMRARWNLIKRTLHFSKQMKANVNI